MKPVDTTLLEKKSVGTHATIAAVKVDARACICCERLIEFVLGLLDCRT